MSPWWLLLIIPGALALGAGIACLAFMLWLAKGVQW